MAYAKNDQAAAKAAREAMDKGSGTNWLKLKAGTTYIRVLPPHINMKDPETGTHRFYHPVSLHFGLGPSSKVVACPRKMLGKFCPACDYAFSLRNKGQEAAGNELLPSWQSYMNVLVFDADGDPVRNKDGELLVYVWAASRGVLDQIFDEIEERETESGEAFIDITDPAKGFVVKVQKKGDKKENTKYRVKLADQVSDITDIEEEWAEALIDVTTLNPVIDTEQVKLILEGSEDDPFAKKALPDGTVDAEYREVKADDDDWGDDAEESTGSDAASALQRMIKDKKGAKNA